MGRFHFHIVNGSGTTPDDQGQELSGPDEARATAIEGARSLLSAEVLCGNLDLRGRIEVTDERGAVIMTVEFRDVLRVQTGELPSGGGERAT